MHTSIIKTTLNGNKVEVTANRSGGGLTCDWVDGGTSNERFVFKYKGRVKRNKPTILGRIKISARDSGATAYMPKDSNLISKDINKELDRKSILQLKLIEVEKRGGSTGKLRADRQKVISRTYDVVYTCKDFTGSSNVLNYTFNHRVRKIATPPLTTDDGRSYKYIKSIHSGKDVSTGGEYRKISIKGDPGTEFYFISTKLIDTFDTNGNIINTVEVDNLDKKYHFNDSSGNPVVHQYTSGEVYNFGKGRLNDKGIFSFIQYFPPNNSSNNQRYSFSIRSSKLNNVPPGQSFQLKEVLPVTSPRSWHIERKYGVEVHPYGWANFVKKILTQPSMHGLKLDISSSNSNISSINGVARGSTIPYRFKGKSSSNYSRRKRDTQVELTYVLISNAHTFAFKGGITNAVQSNWTNSDSKTNGGTLYYINNISVVLSDTGSVGRNNTCTVKWTPDVVKLGNKPITSYLQIDDIVACA